MMPSGSTLLTVTFLYSLRVQGLEVVTEPGFCKRDDKRDYG